MLELHRYSHVDWKPSPVVALATSVDGAVVAAARENGAIEVWIVASGSVGWHCELTIPGKRDAAISSLLWCFSESKKSSPRGRLFSSSLDGFISEWDLSTLEPKDIVKSYGGSVWHMASEPLQRSLNDLPTTVRRQPEGSAESDSDDGQTDGSESDVEEIEAVQTQRVAVACDDGCIRLYTVSDDKDGMIYSHSFPCVQGRILSVAWSVDATKLFSGGSDGCIRCWDVGRIQEVYRITAGLGGHGSGSDMCVWSLLTLRDGTLVSGDSTGSTQFWDGKCGTLLQAYSCHGADVLALATSPSHHYVFAAGADGQVIQFQLVPESSRLADRVSSSAEEVAVVLGDKWVFCGKKRMHTHDVRALAVAFPIGEGETINKATRKKNKRIKISWMEQDMWKWAHPGVPMLISGGNDAKLFTYPANAFLAFHPHDVCFAPQQTQVKLAFEPDICNGVMLMAQYEHCLDVWEVPTGGGHSSQVKLGKGIVKSREGGDISLSKRKREAFESRNNGKHCGISNCNGVQETGMRLCELPNGTKKNCCNSNIVKQMGKVKCPPPELLARIKCKSPNHISCSGLSGSGHLIAFSDQIKPRLCELEQQHTSDVSNRRGWSVRKRRLPRNLPPAHNIAFSADSSRLLLACPHNSIFVVDIENVDVLHRFEVVGSELLEHADIASPITRMCTSADGQWLAVSNVLGDATIFNLETFRQHWSIPRLDGGPITSMMFHPRNSCILVVATRANQLHVLDVEARQFGEWSRKNASSLPQRLLEFPGGIQGLSMSPCKMSSIIAYSSRAMCLIDFQKPVPQEKTKMTVPFTLKDKVASSHLDLSNGSNCNLQNGGTVQSDKNFIVVPFKDPVLFLQHLSDTSVLVIEKPWLDVLHQLPPPVYRHVYGT